MWNTDRIKGMYRQAAGFVPKNILTDKAFDELEDTYKRVRDEILALQTFVDKLKDYEHDGTTYKAIKERIEKVKGKQEIEGEDLIDNMYKVSNQILDNLAKAYPDSDQKKMTLKLIDINKSISLSKHSMNTKLAGVLIYIKQLRNMSVDINDLRTKLKNSQYDAEKAFDSQKKKDINVDPRDVPEVKLKIDNFNKQVESARKLMQEFVDSENHKHIIEGLTDAYKNYYSDIYKSLK